MYILFLINIVTLRPLLQGSCSFEAALHAGQGKVFFFGGEGPRRYFCRLLHTYTLYTMTYVYTLYTPLLTPPVYVL